MYKNNNSRNQTFSTLPSLHETRRSGLNSRTSPSSASGCSSGADSTSSAPAHPHPGSTLPFYKHVILKGLHYLLDYYRQQYREPDYAGIACLKRHLIFEINRLDDVNHFEQLFDNMEERVCKVIDSDDNVDNQLDNISEALKTMLHWLRQFSPFKQYFSENQLKDKSLSGVDFNTKFKSFSELFYLSYILVPGSLFFGLGDKMQSEFDHNPVDYCLKRFILDYVVVKHAETIVNHYAPEKLFARSINFITHKARRLVDADVDKNERLKEQLVAKNMLVFHKMKQAGYSDSELTDHVLKHLDGMIDNSYEYESSYSKWKQSLWSSDAFTSRLVKMLKELHEHVSNNFEHSISYQPKLER